VDSLRCRSWAGAVALETEGTLTLRLTDGTALIPLAVLGPRWCRDGPTTMAVYQRATSMNSQAMQ